jgi:two-component system nitrogen regulation sensor histidine kinase GlnL
MMASSVQTRKTTIRDGNAPPLMDTGIVLNALFDAVLVTDSDGAICYANLAAEQFFSASAEHLCSHSLEDFLPLDSPLFALIRQLEVSDSNLSENWVTLSSLRFGERLVTIRLTSIVEEIDKIVITLSEKSMAEKISRQLTHRKAARSLNAMSIMLAHEVKNPLSGIRGAAQLLEQNSDPNDRELTQLICSETDRICALMDRIETFADEGSLSMGPVNVHDVLKQVQRLAKTSFAKAIQFKENYDPSLPPIHGNRDQLIQVFLNLIKNAAEAVPEEDGEIVITTAYQHGVRLAVPGMIKRVGLPLMICIQDNGGGIPEDLNSCLFDPFVTTKSKGSGLGLAVVAKIINDHGGVIEFDSQPRLTKFYIRLPIFQGDMTREESNP